MKVLKIGIIAFSMGVFTSSCQSTTQCPTSTTDSSSVSAANPADATKVATPTTDSVNSVSVNDSTPGAAGGTAGHTRHMMHRNGHRDTLANNGPDLNASKKREGNFTNGTGADNPGR